MGLIFRYNSDDTSIYLAAMAMPEPEWRDDVRHAIDERKVSLLVSIETKAFDLVNIILIADKLRFFGLSDLACAWQKNEIHLVRLARLRGKAKSTELASYRGGRAEHPILRIGQVAGYSS
ncbi:hypothetical protein TSAR_009997 [Trichomalopsis sarcophagae]|uniref:Uncharacterized protein n=1 Tax=Trichomalopsis sarcophagae TaxID=543379 RepID=A0A232FAU7_9HYME|nr:hypothetical protein TSAR_009997 [Trichomalopsis sarcophagae]